MVQTKREELLFQILLELKQFSNNTNSGIYNGTSPTNITVGGLPAGSNILGLTYDAIIQQMTNTYLVPNFTSFSISGQSTTIEVGTILTGVKNFIWTTSNSGNIVANSVSITDFTNSNVLATGLANDGAESLNIGNVQKIIKANNRWDIAANTTQPSSISSSYTVNWDFLKFYGLTNPTTSAQVRANSSTYSNTFNILIPQGQVNIYFAYDADRASISDSSVKYVEGFNSNVGNTFTESSIVINLPNGLTKTYRLYKVTLPLPYGANATYSVTIPN